MSAVLVFRHVPHEHLGLLAGTFRQAGLSYEYLDVWKHPLSFPPPHRVRALVVMGGPMGVYERDRYPFLSREIACIQNILAAGKPVLGICLGSQLMAAALGARVRKNRRREIGWYPVELTEAGRTDPLFRGGPWRPWVFQWHGDTFDLPDGARRLASSPLCRNQAFRWGQNAYALQFHPEVDRAMVREWMGQPGARREIALAGPGAYASMERGLKRHLPAMRAWGRRVFKAFADLIV